MRSDKKVKVGVVGAGKMSQKTHMPILSRMQKEGQLELVIVCDINIEAAKAASNRYDFSQITHNIDDVFQVDIDALYIFGTAQMHYEYAKRALEAGVHIFIEKPPAPSVNSFQELVQLAQTKNLVGVVGLNRRFQKNIKEIKESLETTGLYAMEAVFHKPVIDDVPPHGAKTWFPINAIHSLDVLLYLQGSIPSKVTTATNSANTKIPQNFSVLLEWEDGVHAVLSSDYSAGTRVERYVVHGYDVSFEVNLSSKPTYTKSKSGMSQIITEEHTVAYRGFDGEHQEFITAIQNNIPAIHSLDRCLDTVYLTELIESGFSGEVPLLEKAIMSAPDIKTQAEKRTSILILNADGIKNFIPKLADSFTLVFPDSLKGMTVTDISHIKALITGPGGVPITKELVDSLPNLEVAGIIGASLKSYNTDVLLNKNVSIFNASDAYAQSVAEFVLMQAIAGVREATISHDVMRSGGWGLRHTKKPSFVSHIRKMLNKSALAPVKKVLKPFWNGARTAGLVDGKMPSRPVLKKDFRESTVGIIGFGAITKKVIPYLHVFDCEVKINSDYLTEKDCSIYSVKNSTLDEVLNCDVVIMLRGLSERTRNSFGANEFSALKDGAVFINAARAGIIDEKAMVSALKENRFYACLDVFHQEPLSRKSELRILPNVFLTSHIGACSMQMREDSKETVLRKVSNYLDGYEVEDVVVDTALLKNMT